MVLVLERERHANVEMAAEPLLAIETVAGDDSE